jgi:hypothetical protein
MLGALLIVVVAVAWVGCSDDDPETGRGPSKSTSTTTTSEPSTTTTESTEEIGRDVAEAYDQWERTRRKLYEHPDPDSPLLDELYTSPAKETARQYLTELKAKGITSPPRPGDVSKWKALDVEVRSPTEAVVGYCYLDGRWILDASGVVTDDKVVTRQGRAVFMKGADGIWRNASFEGGTQQEGVVGCAEQLQ